MNGIPSEWSITQCKCMYKWHDKGIKAQSKNGMCVQPVCLNHCCVCAGVCVAVYGKRGVQSKGAGGMQAVHERHELQNPMWYAGKEVWLWAGRGRHRYVWRLVG